MTSTDLDATASIAVVERFLTALTHSDVDTAVALTTDDLVWHNVGVPPLRGARAVQALQGLARPWMRFDVILHNVTSDGSVVLTERTDLLALGPVTLEFWVCGTFELRDGKVAVWRDYFSMRDMLRGLAVGVGRLMLGRRGGRSSGYLGA